MNEYDRFVERAATVAVLGVVGTLFLVGVTYTGVTVTALFKNAGLLLGWIVLGMAVLTVLVACIIGLFYHDPDHCPDCLEGKHRWRS